MKPLKLASYAIAVLVLAGGVDIFVFDGQFASPVWIALEHQAELAKAVVRRALGGFA